VLRLLSSRLCCSREERCGHPPLSARRTAVTGTGWRVGRACREAASAGPCHPGLGRLTPGEKGPAWPSSRRRSIAVRVSRL